jgi:hypothetical protein
MNKTLRAKFVLYLLGLFAAGVAVGVLFTLRFSRDMIFHPPQLRDLTAQMEHRLDSRLHLTPEQLQKLQPLLEDSSRELQSLHRETMNKINEIVTRTERQITPDLTPDQRTRLEEMSRERELSQKRFAPPPNPGK